MVLNISSSTSLAIQLPSDGEWNTLRGYLGGITVAGGKMKSIGTIEEGTGLWASPNYLATNESGFTGFPGGYLFKPIGFSVRCLKD